MLSTTLLLLTSSLPSESLLATVPDDAYVLIHGHDLAGLRERAERNDWIRLLNSKHGEPWLLDLEREIQTGAHCDLDEMLAIGAELQGEVVFFDTGAVTGFVAEPGADRTALRERMRNWLPAEAPDASRTVALPEGRAELRAWPDDLDGWNGRAGHFAALLDHPEALGLFSGDDALAVATALNRCVAGLAGDQQAPVVEAYRAAGGGNARGVEFFVDFTPLVDVAETELKRAVEGLLPDPSNLLGLERGTWFHATLDISPGTRIEGRGRLHLPADTLAASLADTFGALPRTLPVDLPRGTWQLWAWNWDVKTFFAMARSAAEDAGRGEGFQQLDQAVEAADQMAEVDPIEDVLNQLSGDFAVFHVEPEPDADAPEWMRFWNGLGVTVGLLDGHELLDVIERMFDIGGLHSTFELEEIAGVDTFVQSNDPDGGGLAFLPQALTIGIRRSILERSVGALVRAAGEGVQQGSLMQGTIDEFAGACFLACVEMTPLRLYGLPDVDANVLPPLEPGGPTRDPFDSVFISSARRTADGFDFTLETR